MIKQWNIVKTNFDKAYIIEPFKASDNRGYFIKDYSSEFLKRSGIDFDIKEVFYTYSHKNVIRAIHFQKVMKQGKLVRCLKGSIYDVIVDLRKDSPTYGKWQGFYLNEFNCLEILVPKGFGHGYLVLEDAIVSYKCDEKFFPEYDSGIIWDDKDIDVNWPIEDLSKVIISEKDKNLCRLADYNEG